MRARICKGLTSISSALGIVTVNLLNYAGMAGAGALATAHTSASPFVPRGSVEVVYFADRRQQSVRVVRGNRSATNLHVEREILTFGNDQRVAVFRGKIEPIVFSPTPTAEKSGLPTQTIVEGINRKDITGAKLAILRGETMSQTASSIDLFSFGGNQEFDLIARAVHGVESRYGTDSRMWRLDDFNGPQGPMQVSAAAAIDVGGGDRFDVYENILLGRAYLARLFRRYGNWSDALAAYNWGPGNVDQWIARSRNAAQRPAETSRYVERVLRQALVEAIAGTAQQRIRRQ